MSHQDSGNILLVMRNAPRLRATVGELQSLDVPVGTACDADMAQRYLETCRVALVIFDLTAELHQAEARIGWLRASAGAHTPILFLVDPSIDQPRASDALGRCYAHGGVLFAPLPVLGPELRAKVNLLLGGSRTQAVLAEQSAALARCHSALLRAQERAVRAEHFRTKILAAIVHELGQPLQSLLALAHRLQDDTEVPLRAQHRECADAIVETGRHLWELIHGILPDATKESHRGFVFGSP